MSAWKLSLFIADPEHPKSLAAYANIKRICEEHLPGRYQLHVVDVAEQPELVRSEQLLAIPTLVRNLPEPKRRIIGDLANTEQMLVSLGLKTVAVPR